MRVSSNFPFLNNFLVTLLDYFRAYSARVSHEEFLSVRFQNLVKNRSSGFLTNFRNSVQLRPVVISVPFDCQLCN